MTALASARAPVFLLLYSAALIASIAEGFFLLLPLFVKSIGGTEIDVGWILWGGAAGSVLLVGSVSKLLDYLRPAAIAALGCASYAAGAGIFAFTYHVGLVCDAAGFFQGAGVGLSVTAYPMVVSALVDDRKRSVHFSVLAAFGIAGMGISPVIGAFARAHGIDYHLIFQASAIMSLISAALLALLDRAPAGGRVRSPHRAAPRGALRSVLASEAVFPLIMVFLGTCMFSAMFTFQTTFAVSRGLDFQIFYACYITATIAARLTLSKFVSRADPHAMTVFLLALVCCALASYAFVGSNPLLYGAASALLGTSYGLAYPLVQAHAVNLTAPALRERVLAYFSFLYFFAAFGFPLAGGWVIVRYGYEAFMLVVLAVGVAQLSVACFHWRARARTVAGQAQRALPRRPAIGRPIGAG